MILGTEQQARPETSREDGDAGYVKDNELVGVR